MRQEHFYKQFVPGVYYAGLFNGLGDIRNQPNMQTKSGSAYSFSANVTVEACVDPTKRGQYCDQTVENLGDMEGSGYKYTRRLCLVNTEPKIYSLPTGGPIQMTVKAENIRLNHTLPVGSGLSIMCHARSNGVADEFLYDYSYDLIKSSIVMPATKGDNWYFTMQAVFEPNLQNERPEEDIEVCLSVDWEVMYCPKGTDGPNCESNGYLLQVCCLTIFIYLLVFSYFTSYCFALKNETTSCYNWQLTWFWTFFNRTMVPGHFCQKAKTNPQTRLISL